MAVIQLLKKNLIHKNIYISDFFTRVKGIKQNAVVNSLQEKVKDIDSIKDYSKFAQVIRECVPKGSALTIRCYGGESLLYGHLHALYKYAGIDTKPNIRAFAKLEHGIDSYASKCSPEDINFVENYIFQGSYKKEQIHSLNPYRPVFTIGPYINYAQEIYTQQEMVRLKERFGKTLLVFPFHCYEFSKGFYDDKKFVSYVMNDLAKDFDTVLISVYWNDVDDPIYSKFKIMGAKLVSSGFRGDPNFINRQKTIFQLSDAVCGNSFGTQIGYAMCLDKPYMYIDTGLSYIDKMHRRTEVELAHHQSFDLSLRQAVSDFVPANSETIKKRECLYSKYWGGNSELKTQSEIRAILNLGQYIFDKSHGTQSKFDAIVKEILNKPELISEKMYEQLIKSLGVIFR